MSALEPKRENYSSKHVFQRVIRIDNHKEMMRERENGTSEAEAARARLLIDYHVIFAGMPPMGDSMGNCDGEASAHLFGLEEWLRESPDGLYRELESDIPRRYWGRFQQVLEVIGDHSRDLSDNTRRLKEKWAEAEKFKEAWERNPETQDPIALRAVQEARIQTRRDLCAILALVSHRNNTEWNDLKRWQVDEKNARLAINQSDHVYLFLLRLFRLLLLELPANTDVKPVLREDHPMRRELQRQHRYLRTLHAIQYSFVLSKGLHHQQGKGVLRRSGGAYVIHPWEATLETLLHSLVFMIESRYWSKDPAPMGLVMPAHDVAEDTARSAEKFLFDFMQRDRVDTTISHLLMSVYDRNGSGGREIEKFLSLLPEAGCEEALRILRALSHRTILSPEERESVTAENIAGSSVSRRLLEEDKKLEEKEIGIDSIRRSLDMPEAEREPDDHGGEASSKRDEGMNYARKYTNTKRFSGQDGEINDDHFVIPRIYAITEGTERHCAIICKYEDRINNIKTLDFPEQGDSPPERRKKIRRVHKTLYLTAITLIAYGVYDHNWEEYPVSNTLPVLIRVTLAQYRKLRDEFPRHPLTPEDHQLIEQLQKWEKEFPMHPLPLQNQGYIDKYRELKMKAVDQKP